MKLRLHGTRAEVAQATRRLVQVLVVVSVSQPYPDRGASVLVRVYLEVRLPAATRSTTPAPEGSRTPPGKRSREGRRPRPEVGGR